MSIFNKENKVNALFKLGHYLSHPDEELLQAIKFAKSKNGWFTEEQVQHAVAAYAKLLNVSDLQQWVADYHFSATPKKVGLILAGNIPLVGFHDILSVLISGNIALIKLSSNDDNLIPTILKKLVEIAPEFKSQIIFVAKLEGFDAVIATGSNNTSRYFEHYFSKVPHIIRKNRNSVAVLSGKETKEELKSLGKDIFDYFGLGCRNVSKLYVPEDYNFIPFFEAIEEFHPIANHSKYNNNYDYNKSIYLVNKTEHLDNGFLLVTENKALSSPLAVVFYEKYNDLTQISEKLKEKKEEIQVLATHLILDTDVPVVGFGQSQQPKLGDYADNIDTLAFLAAL